MGGLQSGPVRVSILADGFLPVVRGGVLPGDGDVEEVLVRSGRLEGRVVFRDAGQEGVEILAHRGLKLRYRVFSDRAGFFRFAGIPPGEYRVEVFEPGFLGGKGFVKVPEGVCVSVGEIVLALAAR